MLSNETDVDYYKVITKNQNNQRYNKQESGQR